MRPNNFVSVMLTVIEHRCNVSLFTINLLFTLTQDVFLLSSAIMHSRLISTSNLSGIPHYIGHIYLPGLL